VVGLSDHYGRKCAALPVKGCGYYSLESAADGAVRECEGSVTYSAVPSRMIASASIERWAEIEKTLRSSRRAVCSRKADRTNGTFRSRHPFQRLASIRRVRRRRGQRQHRLAVLQTLGPHDVRLVVDVLHDDGERAVVLPRHRPVTQEVHAEAEHGGALGQVHLERGLAQRVGVDATVLLDGLGQDFG